jgi:alanyl-tRNA synthetase
VRAVLGAVPRSRGVEFGSAEDLPGGENERFLEYWNLVFMQFDQDAGGGSSVLAPLPANNIDTGLGLNRMAAILQGKESVFETDQFQPLIDLGEELSGRRYGEDFASRPRAADPRRPRARDDVPDGRRRGAVERGPRLRAAPRHAPRDPAGAQSRAGARLPDTLRRRVRELMGGAYPELGEQREAIDEWLSAEEEGFGRTLAQGMATLRELHRAGARPGRLERVGEDVFRLHDTYGFPFEMTRELLDEEGLSIEGDFES